MVDFTSAAHQFAQALAEGDLYRALGIPENARRLDIDVAAARISDRAPQLAGQVTTVANVLTNRRRKAIYEILCRLRDRICQMMADRYGREFREAIPDYRAAVWGICCELLRFGLDQSDIVVGPRGAASLAERGRDWVIESLLKSRLVVLKCTKEESREGAATREVWYTECPVCHGWRRIACRRKRPGKLRFAGGSGIVKVLDLGFKRFDYDYHVPSCPDCRAKGVDPSVLDGTYTFRFDSHSPPGTLLRGEGDRSEKALYAVMDGATTSRLSPRLLEKFYTAHEEGQDLTLDEVDDGWQPESSSTRERRATAGAGSGGSRFAPWAVYVIIYVVLRVGCTATSRLADQQERRRETDSWNSRSWQSIQIEPSYLRKILEPDWNRTWRDTSAPSEQPVSRNLSVPPDEDDSELNSRPETNISERIPDE
jgi:hypothetical protein